MAMKHRSRIAGRIDVPPRSSRPDAAIVLAAHSVLSLAVLLPGGGGGVTLALLAGLLLLAILRRSVYAIHAAWLGFFWLFAVVLVPAFQVWPLRTLLPLVLYAAVVTLTPPLRRSVGWLRRGQLSIVVAGWIVATVLVSGLALVAWMVWMKPELGRHLALMPEGPIWIYPFIGLGFAVFNATLEEAIFRGIVMETLDSALGAGYGSVAIQAIAFAAFHYLAGFPNGFAGVSMVFVYGLALGAIRRMSRGMLAPLIAHIGADLTIFTIVATVLFSN